VPPEEAPPVAEGVPPVAEGVPPVAEGVPPALEASPTVFTPGYLKTLGIGKGSNLYKMLVGRDFKSDPEKIKADLLDENHPNALKTDKDIAKANEIKRTLLDPILDETLGSMEKVSPEVVSESLVSHNKKETESPVPYNNDLYAGKLERLARKGDITGILRHTSDTFKSRGEDGFATIANRISKIIQDYEKIGLKHKFYVASSSDLIKNTFGFGKSSLDNLRLPTVGLHSFQHLVPDERALPAAAKYPFIAVRSHIGDNPKTVLHEFVHAVSMRLLAKYKSGTLQDPGALKAAKALNALYLHVKNNPALKTEYGITNLYEFVAEGFSNPIFQNKLDTLAPKSLAQKVSTLFIQNLRKLLGLPADTQSALTALLEHGNKLMGLEKKPTLGKLEDSVQNLLLKPKQTPDVLMSKSEAPTDEELPPKKTSSSLGIAEALGKTVSPEQAVGESTAFASNARQIYASTFGKLDDLITHLPEWAQPLANWALDKLENATGYARDFLTKTFSLQQMSDMVSRINPRLADSITLLRKAVALRNTKLDTARQHIENFILNGRQVLKDASMRYPKIREEFNSIVEASTRKQIDFNDEEQYKDLKDPTRREEWEDLKARYDALPKPVQDLYKGLRNEYETYSSEFSKMIQKASDEAGVPTTGNKILADLLKKKLVPYFPLHRNGDHWLRYFLKEPGADDYTEHVSAFNSRRERREFAQMLQGKNAKEVVEFNRLSKTSLDKMPATSQFKDMIDTLKKANIPDNVLEEIFRSYLDMFPTNSVMQQFQKRKGLAGSNMDALSNFAHVGSRMASNLVHFQSTKDIDAAMDLARGAIGGAAGTTRSELEKSIFNNMLDREQYLKSPMIRGSFAQFASFAGYNSYRYFLLGNISSAVVNLTQPFMTTLPLLGGRYGFGASVRAMEEARKMYFAGGVDNNTKMQNMLTGKPLSDLTFNGDKAGNLAQRYKDLHDQAVNEGAIRRSTGQDLQDIREHGVRENTDAWALMNKVDHNMGWLFQNSERANREVTLLAAYNLEYRKLKGEGASDIDSHKQAADRAIHTTEEANSSSMAETGPSLFYSSVPGKLFGTFKRFGFSQAYLYSKLFAKAFVPESAGGAESKEQQIARKQLAMVYGSAFLFSGLKGVPLRNGVNTLGSMLGNDFSDGTGYKSDMEQYVLRNFGNWALHGPLGALTNVDFGSRTGFSDMLWRAPDENAPGSTLEKYMEIAAGPIMGIAKNFENAGKYVDNGQYERAIEAMMPAVIRNGMKSIRFAAEGATSREGAKFVDNVNAFNVGMQMVGFGPNDLADQYQRNSFMKTQDKDNAHKRTSLLDSLYAAKANHDYDGVRELHARVREYNHSGLGKTTPITANTISASDKNHKIRIQQMNRTHGVYLGKQSSAKVKYLEAETGEE